MATTVFDLVATLGLDTSKYEGGLKDAKSMASSIGGAIGGGLASAVKVGATAVTAATGALVGLGAMSVKTGMSFDSSMSQVAATMGKTMDEMQNEIGTVELAWGTFSGNLREYAQEMGRNTAFSATEAADALNYMALAGYDAQTSMNMLPNVLNLAAAGAMDLARASDMVTDTQTAFGISLERTSQMVDEMAKAASTGNTSVEQLGDAFLTVGGLAQELNGGVVALKDGTTQSVDGIQELEIALTAMANAGIKGSEAGTHMRNMLLKLSSPTSDGAKALLNMGVSVFDTEGKMRSLADIFNDLRFSMESMTQEEKIQTISDLFNTRDLSSAEALLNAVNTSWDDIGESILNAEGAAQKMADTQLDNLEGDITLFKSALEGAQIAISDGLTPQLRQFVEFGTDGLSKLTEAFNEGGIEGAVGVFGTVLADGLNMIVATLPQMIDAGMQLLGALGQGLLDNLPAILDAAVQIIEQFANGIMSALPKLADASIQIISTLGEEIINTIPNLMSTATQLIIDFSSFLSDNASGLLDAAVSMITELANGLIAAIPNLIPAALDAIIGFADALNAQLDSGELQKTAADLITTLVTAIIVNVPKLLTAAVKIIEVLAKGILSAVGILLQAINDIIVQLVTSLGEYIQSTGIIDKGREIIKTLIDGIKQKFSDIILIAKQIPDKIREGIQSAASKIKEAANDIMKNLKEAIKQKIEEAKQWGKDLITNFISGINSSMGNIKSAFSKLGNVIKSLIGFSEPEIGPLSNFHTYAPDMMALFAKGIKDNTDLITRQIQKSFDFKDIISEENLGFNLDTANVSELRATSDQDETKILARMDAMLSIMAKYFPEIAEKMNTEYETDGIAFYNRAFGTMLV